MEWEGPFVKGQTRIIWVCLIFYEIFQKCRSGTFHRKEMEKSMEQLLQVGVITQTHGIRGEVKVFPTTDDPARFERLRKVTLIQAGRVWNWRSRKSGFPNNLSSLSLKDWMILTRWNVIRDIRFWSGGKMQCLLRRMSIILRI